MSQEDVRVWPQEDAGNRTRRLQRVLHLARRCPPVKSRLPGPWLAGGSALLALVLLCLCLFATVVPASGLAAPAAIQPLGPISSAEVGASPMLTSTTFLPFINYQEPAPLRIWLGEYYDNPGLTGSPEYTIEEARIDFDWGEGGPSGLSSNHFSIRWTGDWEFEAGEYTFFVYADDGLRLWLDDEVLIDAWQPGMGEHDETVDMSTAGTHRLKLEYFERTGDAAIQLGWRRTDLYPLWHGTYYREPWVETGKMYEQDDRVIQFDWGDGCPERLEPDYCDSFSISWLAYPILEPGAYRVYINADEGYFLVLDGDRIPNEGWDDRGEDVDYELEVTNLDDYQIIFNAHDRGGPAEARLWIESLEHPLWTAQYYANTSLSGTPVLTKEEEVVFYDWGYDKPRHAMPSSNNFSIRWSGQRYFHSGFYRFGLFADDGVRLWVDGELLVNEWHLGRGEYHSLLTYLETGYHEVIIEYVEDTGLAEIRFWWE